MSTGFKKNELVELISLLGLRTSTKSVKAKLEAEIVKHLSSHPGDVRLDDRLNEFTDKPELVENDDGKEEEETSAEELVEEKLEEITERVDSAWSKFKTNGSRLQTKVANTGAHFRSELSTVASVNRAIIFVECAMIVYLNWPRNILGQYVFSVDEAAVTILKQLALYSAVLLLPALIFSFVVNFTKKSAIRRKKHVYTVDPILYGLTRFFVAVLYHFISPNVQYSVIAGASGLTSALLGIYASILQTP